MATESLNADRALPHRTQAKSNFRVNAYTTEHGPVAHVSLSRTLSVDAEGRVVNEAGEPYAIVHQFDRFAYLERLREARFPIDTSLPPLSLNASALEGSRRHDHKSTTERRVRIG
jgi:hypothetical protein